MISMKHFMSARINRKAGIKKLYRNHQFFIDYRSVMTVVIRDCEYIQLSIHITLTKREYHIFKFPFRSGRRDPKSLANKGDFTILHTDKHTSIYQIFGTKRSYPFCILFYACVCLNPFIKNSHPTIMYARHPQFCLQGVFYCVHVTLSPQNMTPSYYFVVGKNGTNELCQDSSRYRIFILYICPLTYSASSASNYNIELYAAQLVSVFSMPATHAAVVDNICYSTTVIMHERYVNLAAQSKLLEKKTRSQTIFQYRHIILA